MVCDNKIFEIIKTINIDYLLNKDKIYPLLYPVWYKNSDNTISLVSYYYRKNTLGLNKSELPLSVQNNVYSKYKKLTQGELQKERKSNTYGIQYGTIIKLDFTFQDVKQSGDLQNEIKITDKLTLDTFLAPYLRKIKLSKVTYSSQ